MKTNSEKFKSNGEAPPMFKNKFLNRLSQTHIATPIIIFIVYAIALLWYTVAKTDVPALAVVGLFFAGTLGFTFMEYVVHRWVYHPPHDASDKYKEMTYNMHGFHHDYPKDKKRLAMPPVLAVIISTILLFLFELVLQQFAFAYLFSGALHRTHVSAAKKLSESPLGQPCPAPLQRRRHPVWRLPTLVGLRFPNDAQKY